MHLNSNRPCNSAIAPDGGAGGDWLEGGRGADVYSFSGAFGADTIEDSGNDGSIQLAGRSALNGGDASRTSATTWRSSDGQVTYSLAEQDLVITVAGGGNSGSITVRNWSNGGLGITLSQTQAPVPVATLSGDIIKATSGNQYQFAADGNDEILGSANGRSRRDAANSSFRRAA